MKNKWPLATAVALLAGASSSQADMTIINIGQTAPSSDVFESFGTPASNTVTRLSNTVSGSDRDRGQTFTAPQIGDSLDSETWSLRALTVQMTQWQSDVAPTGAVGMNLSIVNWTGSITGANAGSEIFNQSASFPIAAFTALDYFTFDLGTTVSLTEGSNYAFLLSFDNDNAADIRPAIGQNEAATHPGVIWTGGSGLTGGQDMVFYLTAVPEPALSLTSAPTAYLNWTANYPELDLADPSADYDHDELPNILEAWFGTDPGAKSVGLGLVSAAGSTIVISHPQNASPLSDVQGTYQWSPNNLDWYESGDGPAGGPSASTTSDTVGSTTNVTFSFSEEVSSVSIRVVVSSGSIK